jgi:two-component system, response regulator YesN
MKLKVFLVEDEATTRTGIRENIPWDMLDLNYIGEAQNGEEAYPMILELKPDILISDIKMPKLNGIDLCSIIKSVLPWIQIILISAFDEFSFAQQAIDIGVQQYVLKPITPKKLIHAIEKVKKNYSNEIIERQNNLSFPVEGDVLLPPNVKDIHKDFEPDTYVIAVISDENNEKKVIQSAKLYDDNKHLLFFTGQPPGCLVTGESETHCRENAYKFINTIDDGLFNPSCFFALGSTGLGEEGVMESYHTAIHTRNHRHLFGEAKIISYTELELLLSNNRKLVNFDSDALITFILEGTEKEAEGFIESLLRSPKSISLGMGYFLTFTVMGFLTIISSFIAENIGDPTYYIPALKYPDILLDQCKSFETTIATLSPVLKSILRLREKIKSPYFSLIQKAALQIDQHYQDPNYSLLECAEANGMSPAHFSTIFKQTMSVSFIKYLTRLRIEKAKALLKSTAMQSAEIAQIVGYRDAHYFSFVFRKNTGITPTAYRGSLYQDDE